jgi:soluble lytic murein transglycosylase-like protein
MRLAGSLASVALLLGGASFPAAADLVYLPGGRSLSVKTYRYEGAQIVLGLRGGGEIVCDAGWVEAITPDEVPYPEPEAETAPVVVAPAAASTASTRFAEFIEPLARQHGVDPVLVRAVVEVESNYEPAARSHKGAMGLMQLMPATARRYALVDPYEPRANLEAGIRHLRSLLDRFDLRVALAAYNAGEGAVLRHGGIPPFAETRAYVSRVLQRAGASAHARR